MSPPGGAWWSLRSRLWRSGLRLGSGQGVHSVVVSVIGSGLQVQKAAHQSVEVHRLDGLGGPALREGGPTHIEDRT